MAMYALVGAEDARLARPERDQRDAGPAKSTLSERALSPFSLGS